MLSDKVWDKVKVQWVLAIKKNTFNQCHDVTCRVIFGTNNCNMYHLQRKNKISTLNRFTQITNYSEIRIYNSTVTQNYTTPKKYKYGKKYKQELECSSYTNLAFRYVQWRSTTNWPIRWHIWWYPVTVNISANVLAKSQRSLYHFTTNWQYSNVWQSYHFITVAASTAEGIKQWSVGVCLVFFQT